MDNRDEVKAFLRSRRARITPGQAGLTSYTRNRRVPGLRRSEVADLAGVSVEYYAELERGNLAGASDGVLAALARALQLDEAEQQHLAALARAASPASRTHRKPPAPQIRPSVARLLDLMTDIPAFVNTGRGWTGRRRGGRSSPMPGRWRPAPARPDERQAGPVPSARGVGPSWCAPGPGGFR
jgi:transcriptional regulator with XRE-family HTH domain